MLGEEFSEPATAGVPSDLATTLPLNRFAIQLEQDKHEGADNELRRRGPPVFSPTRPYLLRRMR